MLFALLAQSITPSASSSGSRATGGVSTLIFFALIIGAFYFLMIRPQRNRARQHQDLVRAIEVGDEVETAAGMFGIVKRATDDIVWVEIVPGAEPVKMSRAAIRRRIIDTQERS
ncbi:MAG: preprotein translocase subunit YajC [Actinomycetota bacterium]